MKFEIHDGNSEDYLVIEGSRSAGSLGMPSQWFPYRKHNE